MLQAAIPVTRLAIGLGASLALVMLIIALVGRFGPTAHAQPAAPVSITEREISLDGANTIVAAAVVHSRELGLAQVIVVMDASGLMKAMVRMDTARVSSITIAADKAFTAAVRRQSSEDFGKGLLDNPASLHSTAVQPHMYLGAGGIPIVVDGQVIGAVGVSGGTGAQDVEVAKAGLAALP
jgi:uncharacterized protein GlcG (DUF336 family)